MFKRLSVQTTTKLVKNKKPTEEAQTENKTLADYVPIITEVGKKAVIGAVVIIGSTIVLDTLRQVTVETVKKH
jgi:hypothetical protein